MRRQVEREMGGRRIGDFTLLVRLGTHLPGAVSVHAAAEPSDDLPVGASAGIVYHPLRPSLAGVQLKYSMAAERLTYPASGEGAWWIVKLPDPSLRDLTTNEYLTMRWLASAGFDVPLVRLERAATVPDIPAGLVDPNDLAPVYDFHSLTVYDRFKYAPLALSINGEVMSAHLSMDDFRRLADRCGADPDDTVGVVNSAVYELRRAWRSGVAEEVESRFAALAKHYEHRLASLPLATAG